MNTSQGVLFLDEMMAQVRSCFHCVEADPLRPGRRIYFDNAGGAFRLKRALEAFHRMDSLPDCPERAHQTAVYMNDVIRKGEEDIRVIFNASAGGRLVTMLTASQVIFSVTGVIAENVPGTNIVTTALEHPCAFDAVRFYCDRTGKELRVAKTNPLTGGVDADEIARLVDANTCMLSVIHASNISGAVLDIAGIVKAARAIKPGLHVFVDSVQHAPHGAMDVDALGLDGVAFAPYKFFGVRGSGIGYVSDRVSALPHHRLLGKDTANWTLGSPAPAHYAVASEIVDYVCWLGRQFSSSTDRRELFVEGMSRIKLHERALLHRMLEGAEGLPGLRHLKGVKVYLDHPDLQARDLIVALGLDNWGFTAAVREYERRGVIVFERLSSSIYSKRMLESFGMDGAIRVSPLHCNHTDEIDEFLRITRDMSRPPV
jgi:cysteine desulfurase / selenocysteine lyase